MTIRWKASLVLALGALALQAGLSPRALAESAGLDFTDPRQPFSAAVVSLDPSPDIGRFALYSKDDSPRERILAIPASPPAAPLLDDSAVTPAAAQASASPLPVPLGILLLGGGLVATVAVSHKRGVASVVA